MAFPPPPKGNRSPISQTKAVEAGVTPFDNKEPELEDPRMTDEQVVKILQQTLRHDQLNDPRIIKFVLTWCSTRSNTDAAEAAGFERRLGSYYRSRPEIHKAIEEITAIAVVKHGYDASEMIERAKEIANLDPIEFQNPDGSFKTHLSQIKPEARRAIKKFEAKNLYGQDANGMQIVIGQLIKVEVWDKLKGIELLGSEKNIFKKTTVVQHDVTSNMANLLLESGKRADERKLIMSREVGDATQGNEADHSGSEREEDGVPIAIGGGESSGNRSNNDLEAVFEEEGDEAGDNGPL
jgi:hypothetical protein